MIKNNFENNNWFTLIEILVWILITTIIIIIWFKALTVITIWKVKLIESTNIEKETFFFNQKLFEEIKRWGLVDYEEYFNRNQGLNANYEAGHYLDKTWFGNFWNAWVPTSGAYGSKFYYCEAIWTNWCAVWTFQRYWEYSFQFIDYDSNNNWWDEDGNGSVIWDDDDLHLWDGPTVFTSGAWVTEIYLISANKRKRTYFRWNVEDDPYYPAWNCTFAWQQYPTWSGCLWTIEFLRLEWKDWWMNHDSWTVDADGTQYDWVIDTWIYDVDFTWGTEIIAQSTLNSYRLPLFPDSINVANFEVFVYPNKDIKEAWKNASIETNTAPYIRLKLKLLPSWKRKNIIKWKIPEFEISTTISLTDIYSR